MYSAASGWLMSELNAEPIAVALVQAAATLPMFLFAVPAGALADITDKRTFLLIGEICVTITATLFAVVVWRDLTTPTNILVFTFLSSTAVTLTSPAWQAVVPQLVPKRDLSSAIAANSVGMNVSRAVGSALGGGAATILGVAAPFWINAFSNVGVIAVLLSWKPTTLPISVLPVERFGSAIRVAFRHARHNSDLLATLIRALAFFFFASAYWALLPLVARTQLGGGPSAYGYFLGAIGFAAIVGALLLRGLERRLGPDRVVIAGTAGTAVALVLFGTAQNWWVAFSASLLAGASWITVVASLNVSAQVALPDWVRARGLAIFVSVFFGALALGSVFWGLIGNLVGLSEAHFLAAAGLLAAIPATRRWTLHAGARVDLAPSMFWPAPVISEPLDYDRGPVLVTVEYMVAPEDRKAFLKEAEKLGADRKREGAYAWGIFEDVEKKERFLEAFLVESWVEHLRQHERTTVSGRALQSSVTAFNRGLPVVSHLVAHR